MPLSVGDKLGVDEIVSAIGKGGLGEVYEAVSSFMKKLVMNSVLVLIAALGLFVPSVVSAQWINYPTAGVPRTKEGKPNLSAPTPRTAEGKPDLSGLWDTNRDGGTIEPVNGGRIPPLWVNIGAGLKDGLPYRPWARDLRDARRADNSKDAPDARCLPLSILLLHSHFDPRRILQVPNYIAILYEVQGEYRQIFTDGRSLPVDPQPTFSGYSTGKWEGDTLVVRTIGFRDDLWADYGGSPLTESAKVTERFRRLDYGNLEIEMTVDDPKAYTAPWTAKVYQHIRLDSDLLEYVCQENEKDRAHLK